MTAAVLWVLLVFSPVEGAGRTVGPFDSAAQCAVASVEYNRRFPFHSPASTCIQVSGRTTR